MALGILRRRRADDDMASTAMGFDPDKLEGQGLRGQMKKVVADDERQMLVDAPEDDAELEVPAKLTRKQLRAERKQLEGDLNNYPHLLAMRPREGYIFYSDYIKVDDSYMTVLAYFHRNTAQDGFPAFWGIDRVPGDLGEDITTVVLEQVHKMSDKWVDSATKKSETLSRMDELEQDNSSTASSRRKAGKKAGDREQVIAELLDGAAYLSVHNRLLVKAPTLERLDEAVESIGRLYVERFGTLSAAPYLGEQRRELSTLLQGNERKRGNGFHFTSTEFAGSYHLVTNGINDPTGHYVGSMEGDLNNSAVIFDPDLYDSHVVIADSTLFEPLGRARMSNMWCSKLSQQALLRNRRVVHLVLDGTDLDRIGPSFDAITARVDLSRGDVNMFEMFGEPEDELSIFASQMQKIKLMYRQLQRSLEGAISSIVDSSLEDVLTEFYIDQGMWRENAKNNRDALRVVGLPHDQVPTLHTFSAYLRNRYDALKASSARDQTQIEAVNVLRGLTRSMLSSNGDLFNNITASAFDGIRDASRVIYDMSSLMPRGPELAMAQLVNIVGFAVGQLREGDVVLLHGVENIDDDVKGYLSRQFDYLRSRGGRVVYSYNNVDKMLADVGFNTFDEADYTLLGRMRDKSVKVYREHLGQEIPPDLIKWITFKGRSLMFLRRGSTNVVFDPDLSLGINPARQARREAARRQAQEQSRQVQAEQQRRARSQATRRRRPVRDGEADNKRMDEGRARVQRPAEGKKLVK